MNGDEKVVVSKVNGHMRVYWLSEDITSCEIDILAVEQKIREEIKARLEEIEDFRELAPEYQEAEIKRHTDFNMFMSHQGVHGQCSLSKALAEIKHIEAQHDTQSIHVAINPARTSWSVVHAQLKPIICEIFGSESFELEEVVM